MGLMFLALEPWAGWSGKGMGGLMWGTPHSLDVPSNFYPSHVGVGPACSTALPLLPIWMNVVSLIP